MMGHDHDLPGSSGGRTRLLERFNPEMFVWLAALLWLGLSTPAAGPHFTLCPLANFGMTFCPGCGLGRSVSYALHGQMLQSLHEHLLGIPAVVILVSRIGTLMANALRRPATLPFHNDYRRNIHA